MPIAAPEALLLSRPLPEPLMLPFWGGERALLQRHGMLVCATVEWVAAR